MIKHEDIRNFVAKGELYRGDVSVPAIITGSYQIYEAGWIQFKISPDMDSLPQPGIFGEEEKVVNLRGRLADGRQIWTPNLQINTWGGIRGKDTGEIKQYLWEGVAEFFAEGDLEDFDASAGTLLYTLVANPSPLADPGVSYIPKSDGTITWYPEEGEKKHLRWHTPIGDAVFTDSFTYPITDNVGYYQTQLRIRQFVVAIERRLEGVVSPKALLEELTSMFQSVFSVVSLLSRRRVDWYRARLIYLPDNNLERDSRTAIAQRRRWLGYMREIDDNTHSVSLVRLNHLRDGLFERLVNQFGKTTYRSALDGIITHLMVSHEDVYLQNRYVSAFTALESLVNILAEDNQLYSILDDDSFKGLMQKLKTTVKETLPGKGNKNLRASLYSKLLELSRRALIEKLILLKDQYELQLSALWPEGSDIDFELDRLVKRRNNYLHQGTMDNPEAYLYDLNRIQNIVELWILRLLDVPQDAVNPVALGHLVPIDRHNPT